MSIAKHLIMHTVESTYRFLAPAHRCSWNVAHVSALMHVIVHRNVKQIVRFVTGYRILLVVSPRETMTMNWSFMIEPIPSESVRANKVVFGSIRQVSTAQIRIVTGIPINAVFVVWLRTVAVVIIRLTILRPAAHS